MSEELGIVQETSARMMSNMVLLCNRVVAWVLRACKAYELIICMRALVVYESQYHGLSISLFRLDTCRGNDIMLHDSLMAESQDVRLSFDFDVRRPGDQPVVNR